MLMWRRHNCSSKFAHRLRWAPQPRTDWHKQHWVQKEIQDTITGELINGCQWLWCRCCICFKWSCRRSWSLFKKVLNLCKHWQHRTEMFKTNLAHSFAKHDDVNSTDLSSSRLNSTRFHPCAWKGTPSLCCCWMVFMLLFWIHCSLSYPWHVRGLR